MQLQRQPHKQQPPQKLPQTQRPLLWPQPPMLWLNKHPLLFPELFLELLLELYLDNLGHKGLHNNLDNLGQWHQVKSDQEHQVKSDQEHQVKSDQEHQVKSDQEHQEHSQDH